VLTHGDDIATFDVIRQTSGAIARQLHNIFGLRFVAVGEHAESEGSERRPRPFNVVGISRYWKGAEGNSEKKEYWLERSGIPQLRLFLDGLAEKRSAEASRPKPVRRNVAKFINGIIKKNG